MCLHPASLQPICAKSLRKLVNEWQSCHPNMSARNSEHKATPRDRLDPSVSRHTCLVHATLRIFHPSSILLFRPIGRRKRKRRREKAARPRMVHLTVDLVLPSDQVHKDPIQLVQRIREAEGFVQSHGAGAKQVQDSSPVCWILDNCSTLSHTPLTLKPSPSPLVHMVSPLSNNPPNM